MAVLYLVKSNTATTVNASTVLLSRRSKLLKILIKRSQILKNEGKSRHISTSMKMQCKK